MGCFGAGDDGTVAEGCVANCAIVTKEKVFMTPPPAVFALSRMLALRFDGILKGTTVRKAMQLIKDKLLGEAGDRRLLSCGGRR